MSYHPVEKKLLGLAGEWVPVHRDLARAGRQRCTHLSQIGVLSIVLELWQEQQGERSAKRLSAEVQVSVRAVYREMQAHDPKSTTTVRRVLDRLVELEVLADTGDRGARDVRILSVQPLIDAIRPPTGAIVHPGPPDTRSPTPDRVSGGPEQGRLRTRNGVDCAPGHRVSDGPPSEKETSPPVPGGEERSRGPGSGRAGPLAQPPPAPSSEEWHQLEDELRARQTAAPGRSAEERTAAVLLRRARSRDDAILSSPLVVELLTEIRARPSALAVAS